MAGQVRSECLAYNSWLEPKIHVVMLNMAEGIAHLARLKFFNACSVPLFVVAKEDEDVLSYSGGGSAGSKRWPVEILDEFRSVTNMKLRLSFSCIS